MIGECWCEFIMYIPLTLIYPPHFEDFQCWKCQSDIRLKLLGIKASYISLERGMSNGNCPCFTQGNCATEGNSGNCHSGNCHSGERWMRKPSVHARQMKIKWRHRQHCEWSRQQHVLLYVIMWQMISFQALWKTKSCVKVCLKFKLPLWTKGLVIHLSPLWQLPLWHFPRWHNFPVYSGTSICKSYANYAMNK